MSLRPCPRVTHSPSQTWAQLNRECPVPIPSPPLVSQLTWVLSPGESTTTVSPFVPGGVSDGQWHRVQLKYYNKVGVGGSRRESALAWVQMLSQTWGCCLARG